MNKVHKLKTWPGSFSDIVKGKKTFEIRKNDRDFEVSDILDLNEYDPILKKYSGRNLTMRVQYILKNAPFFGLKEGYCIMSIFKYP